MAGNLHGCLRRLIVAAVCLLAPPALASGELVVISIEGSILGVKEGQMIAPGKQLTLPPASTLRLLSSAGKVTMLKGPFSGALPGAEDVRADTTGESQDITKLAQFLTERPKATTALGTMRSLGPSKQAQGAKDPWLIIAGQSGEQCARPPKTELWRKNAKADETLILQSKEGISAKFTWPAGKNSLELAREFALDGETVQVTLGKRKSAITLHLLPMWLNNHFEIVNWMIKKDCRRQADHYLSLLQ
ncbi:MAG: hypothetical protein HQL45_13180 [Alphaproteobacteria bacterium]|nr:hypothetical protein [Alphaproteobacteria bacterium]